MSPSRTSIDSAGAWFLRSGIQEPNGGVARYYHSDVQRNARVSTEITGYAISTLVYLYDETGDAAYREAATRAGQFLLHRAWNVRLEAFPFEYSEGPEKPEALAYFFDTGIIIRALLTLARLTNDSEYRDVAIQAGVTLAADFAGGNTYHPILTLPGKAPLPWRNQWSRGPGCYQLKSAMAWHDLYEATGDRQFLAWYKAEFTNALSSHDSFLPAESQEGTMDRLHAYCYFMEGLLPYSNKPECKSALAAGIGRVARYLREIAPVFERSDVYGQLLRIRVLADSLGAVPVNREQAEEEAAHIPEFQFAHSDARIRGGFWFGRKGPKLLPFVNPVSTAFCLQALDMWQKWQAGLPLDRKSLI